jgi:hypothetical protein
MRGGLEFRTVSGDLGSRQHSQSEHAQGIRAMPQASVPRAPKAQGCGYDRADVLPHPCASAASRMPLTRDVLLAQLLPGQYAMLHPAEGESTDLFQNTAALVRELGEAGW